MRNGGAPRESTNYAGASAAVRGECAAPRAAVGIDLGIKNVAVTSDGERLEAIRFYRDAQCRLKALQRRAHRRQAQRLHRKIRRRRLNACHQRNTTRVCSSCGALTGPSGPRHLAVRQWKCADCGQSHDRDVNAARNILTVGSRCRTSVRGNEPFPRLQPSCEISISQLTAKCDHGGGTSTGVELQLSHCPTDG